MDSYRPLLTKKTLKDLCDQKRRLWNTPLEQARRSIYTIKRLRNQKPYRYELGEWETLPENQKIMKIAKEYLKRKTEERRVRREARKEQLRKNGY